MPVTRLEITSQKPFAGGQSFGDVGPYTQIDGIAHLAVDPLHPANETIADIKLAPRNAQGLVEFSADFRILRPDDPAKGNRRLLLDVAESRQGPGPAQHQQRSRHRTRRAVGPRRRLPDAAVAIPSSGAAGSTTSPTLPACCASMRLRRWKTASPYPAGLS